MSRRRGSAGWCLACALSAGGCAVNMSPIHTDLADDELDRRVALHFAIGMPGSDAVRRLDNLGLPHRVTSIPPRDDGHPRDHGIAADVRPPGLICTDAWSATSWGRLYLWFSRDDRLERVAYQRRFPWNSRRAPAIIRNIAIPTEDVR